MKFVYLHGVGIGDPAKTWLGGLVRGLEAIEARQMSESQVITPQYAAQLHDVAVSAEHPEITYRVRDNLGSRREVAHRQARVSRVIAADDLTSGPGLQRVPDKAAEQLHIVVVATPIFDHVYNSMTYEGPKAAVLQAVLDEVPRTGKIVLIGHSLGSIIAIDLLDHLPPDLHVARSITIGSPAGSPTLHHERILKRFPYARVDDWSNILDPRDAVTAGRGLAALFPGAQDVRIHMPLDGPKVDFHRSAGYLAHRVAVRLVDDAINPSTELVVTSDDLTPRLYVGERAGIETLASGRRTVQHLEKKRAERYEAALRILRDRFVTQCFAQRGSTDGASHEVGKLAKGFRPTISGHRAIERAVAHSAAFAFSPLVQPFEIEIGDAGFDAIPSFFVDLGFTAGGGAIVRTAVLGVRNHVRRVSPCS